MVRFNVYLLTSNGLSIGRFVRAKSPGDAVTVALGMVERSSTKYFNENVELVEATVEDPLTRRKLYTEYLR